MCSLDGSSQPPFETGLVWLVDLGAWPTESRELFERVRDGKYTRILWDATSDESPMVKALTDPSRREYSVTRG